MYNGRHSIAKINKYAHLPLRAGTLSFVPSRLNLYSAEAHVRCIRTPKMTATFLLSAYGKQDTNNVQSSKRGHISLFNSNCNLGNNNGHQQPRQHWFKVLNKHNPMYAFS